MSATPASRRQGRLLTLWAPEDKSFWEREGEAIAKLNLWISVPALFLAFAIWQVWSVVAVSLPGLGFKYSTNQLFWLAAAPALSGATLRIFYSFMVPLDGDLHRQLADPCDWHRLCGARQHHDLSHHAHPGAAVRPGRRQLQLQHGQHQFLLSEGAQGLSVGRECRSG